jgi:hypothetical protein
MTDSLTPDAFWLDMAKQEIFEQYSHTVSIGSKSLLRFGRAQNLGTSETEVNDLNQNETVIAANLIDTVSSANDGDTQTIVVEGHTIGTDGFTYVKQTVTLNGQNKVALDTPLARCSNGFNFDSTVLAGKVYIYEDTAIVAGVPTDLTKVHNTLTVEDNDSVKASATTAKDEYLLITNYWASINKKQSAQCDLRVKTKQFNKVFRTSGVASVSEGNGPLLFPLRPFQIVVPNMDVAITAKCSVTGVDLSVGFMGLYAKITNGRLSTLGSNGWEINK